MPRLAEQIVDNGDGVTRADVLIFGEGEFEQN